MKWNTRFCPTITAPELHVGHLYTALVNEREAHRSGGRFSIRIDDTQLYWISMFGDQFEVIGNKYISQIEQFMQIDGVSWQSKMPNPASIIGKHQKFLYDMIFSLARPERMVYDLSCEWITDRDLFPYPYAMNFTFEKVVWDFYEGINWMIRGEDLIIETSLYHFFTDLFGFPWVLQSYLPRLKSVKREGLRNTAPVSKKRGNYRLGKQIELFGRDGVIDLLKQSCLIDINGDFYIENIKWNPTIVGFEP
jgi:glutamyl/glutaminyl-tRNA synthetase